MTKPTLCQDCLKIITPFDQEPDLYARLCRRCWDLWQIEAEGQLIRYGSPKGKTCGCASCGMMFGGTHAFAWHRHHGQCLSPGQLKAKHPELRIKQGIWTSAPPEKGFSSIRHSPNSNFPEQPIPTPHPREKTPEIASCGVQATGAHP